MEFVFNQLIISLIRITLIVGTILLVTYKVKAGKKGQAITLGLIMTLFILFNPLKMSHQGGKSFVSTPNTIVIPEKIEVTTPSYKERQETELYNLKLDSKRIHDEIYD